MGKKFSRCSGDSDFASVTMAHEDPGRIAACRRRTVGAGVGKKEGQKRLLRPKPLFGAER